MKLLYFSKKKKLQQLYCPINVNNFLSSSGNKARTYSALKTEDPNDVYCVTYYLKKVYSKFKLFYDFFSVTFSYPNLFFFSPSLFPHHENKPI